MRIGYLNPRYAGFMHALDSHYFRACRPAIGPLFHRPTGIDFYAPLGTSHHGNGSGLRSVKLWDVPKSESEGFVPIGEGCKFGGVYLDRLTPVPSNKPLFSPWEEVLARELSDEDYLENQYRRYILEQQEAWLEEHAEHLAEKAEAFYELMKDKAAVRYLSKKGVCTPHLTRLEKVCWDFNPDKLAKENKLKYKNAPRTKKVFGASITRTLSY